MPPIHPIGLTNRKGANNSLTAGPGDPGSPWAIGGPDGGHDAIHPDLGTEKDFVFFLGKAKQAGLEIALDLAARWRGQPPAQRDIGSLKVAGGGVFADAVRSAQQRFTFSDAAAHAMALLAMEQYAALLADLDPALRRCADAGEIRAALAAGSVA